MVLAPRSRAVPVSDKSSPTRAKRDAHDLRGSSPENPLDHGLHLWARALIAWKPEDPLARKSTFVVSAAP
jgi:hypothetical protein